MEGNKDLLVPTKSEIIEDIHREYFAVGSDTVETNTFNGISLPQGEYYMQSNCL